MKFIQFSALILFSFVLVCPPSHSYCAYKGKAAIEKLLLLRSDAQKYGPKLQNLMDEVMADFDNPGMAMAIKFPDGSVVQHASGYADPESEELLSMDHFFRIGSVSKTITATAVLLLCQDGEFTLDDTIETLLPELSSFSSTGIMYGKGVTVRSLLQHTSGLDDYVEGEYDGVKVFNLMKENRLREWQPETLVQIGVDMGLLAGVGERFSYSNTNYILLGLLIEKYGGGYEQFVQARIIDVLGLDNTLSPTTSEFPGRFAHGYLERDYDGKLYDYSLQHPSGVWSAGNIISTPSDVLQWLEALIEGDLLTPSMKAEQFNMEYFPDARISYGLGVASFDGAVGHNGTVLGYQTWMTHYRGTYFVIYNNSYFLSSGTCHISLTLFERMKSVLFPE